jgi:hypothetical protein
MRDAGWLVLPKGANALETGHFYYVLREETTAANGGGGADGEAMTSSAGGGGGASGGGDSGAPRRDPFFTGATAAENWWNRRCAGHHGAAGSTDDEPVVSNVGATWLFGGNFVEVKMDEDGLRGSRYSARIITIEAERAFVEFPAFFQSDEDDETHLTDWVRLEQLWPQPPPPPPDFFERLEIGEPLELYHEDGWWEVALTRSRQAPGGNMSYHVTSALYGTERWASPKLLRPRWKFVRRELESGVLAEYWEALAPEGLVVWEDTQQHALLDNQDLGAQGSDGGGDAPAANGEGRHDAAAASEQEGGGGGGGGGDERARLLGQFEEMHRLAAEYRARVCEVSNAALRIYPLAHSAVVTAGGTLAKPECFTRPLPPLPGLPPLPPPPSE